MLHGVDLDLSAGEVYALLGPNGAGKSTTLAVASGQIVPSSGSLLVCGRDVTGVTSDALARAGVCLIPEGRGIFPNLTVTENLRMATFTGTRFGDVQDRVFTQFPRLRRTPAPDGRHPVGRRAADARDGRARSRPTPPCS